MSSPTTTIPKGSLVLVTGATGHIAAHTARLFLERGYRVRGTVRDLKAASWLKEDIFKPYADSGALELIHVPDMSVKNAFAEAVKGVSAIAHIASIMSWSNDPNEVIPPVIDSVNDILGLALKEPSVKSFVYTSSIAAAVSLEPGVKVHAGPDTWNDADVKLAWSEPPHAPDFWHHVYMASKVEAEKAVWAFAEREKPPFTVNVISPATVLGEPLHQKHLMTPYPWVKKLRNGDDDIGAQFQAIVHIDVKDTALLHLAVILDPDCNNKRLQAWAEYCNMNDILAILRKLEPQRKFRDDFTNQTKLSITTDTDEQIVLLKKWGGQDGWTSLEESVGGELKGIQRWHPEE